jgi:hypothetical protein
VKHPRVAYTLLGAIGGLILAGRRRDRERAAAAHAPAAARAPAPPVFAYIYQRPDEVAVRMSSGTSPATAVEMGIFGTVEKAQEIAKQKGWTLAWEGARAL